MMKYISKVEGFLKIGDRAERQQALIGYARFLDIDVAKARKSNGAINEDQLTVLIFNAERTRAMQRFGKIGFLFGGILIVLMVIAAGFLFGKFLK